MDIGFLIPSADRSSAPPSSSALSETGQFQQPTQDGTFSAILKNAVQHTDDEQPSSLSDTVDPLEPAPPTEADDQATGAGLSGIAIAALFHAQDLQQSVSPVLDKAESVQYSMGLTLQSHESIPLISQGLNAAMAHDDGTLGHELAQAVPPQPRAMDSSIDSLLRPVLDHDRSSDTSAKHAGARSLDVPSPRNGRGTPVDLPPASLEQLFGHSTLPTAPPPGSLISEQEPSSVMENEEARNLLPVVSVNGDIQALVRPWTGVQPSAMVQDQGTQKTALLGQSLSVPVIVESGGGEHDPFGSDAQGAGDGAFFHSGENGTPESGTRDNQSPFFNGQFTSARQAQSSTESVVTPAADQLKMTQALLGEDRSATMTSAAGKSQVVHVELPSHDSGPLSVRISMTDQTVHTQFTTDRNDLGAFLMGRQDQLQQNLIKSGLELGQFQVHIDQRSQQEAFPDRQSRRNGEASEQQPALQDHKQQAQDRERPNHRSPRALSLFA